MKMIAFSSGKHDELERFSSTSGFDMDSCSILGLIKDLAKHHLAVSATARNEKALHLGQNSLDLSRQTRQLTIKIYESLLTYHGPYVDPWAPMSVYDRLYAVCYEKKLRNQTLDADKLSSLTDALRLLDSTDDKLRNILRFLLHLTRERARKIPAIGSKEFHQQFRYEREKPAHSYSFYPREVFESSNLDSANQQFVHDLYDAEVFSMPPGFFSISLPLKCNHMGQTLSHNINGAISNFYGALSRPHSGPWELDTKLEIPELNEEPSPLAEKIDSFESKVNIANLRKTIEMNGADMSSKINCRRQEEEDEGFTELNSTPSSIECLDRIGEDSSAIWDLALTEDFLKNPPPKCKTWEYFKCLEPVMEKPFLTEAGPEAFNHVMVSQCEGFSIFCPGGQASIRKCRPSEILQKSLFALTGISSDIYPFDENTTTFYAVTDVTISGISSVCLHNILLEFASSGTDHARLHKLEASLSAGGDNCGCVWQAFADGIRRYLYHREAVITNIFPDKNEMKTLDKTGTFHILHLVEQTSALRFQTRFLAELCQLSDGYGINLPPDICLVPHLYAATLHSLGNPDTFPVALSLLQRTFAPYFHFLKMWAFEGRLEDCHDEFSILVNRDHLDTKDCQVWNEGFLLKSGDDPILGDLLSKVLVCGKSLYLLKRCNPTHYLCRLDVTFPALALKFLEVELQKVDVECCNYVKHISKLVDVQKMQRLNAREEMLKKMRVINIRNLEKLEVNHLKEKGLLVSKCISSALATTDKILSLTTSNLQQSNCQDADTIEYPTNEVQLHVQDANANPLDMERELTNDSQNLNDNEGEVIDLVALRSAEVTAVELKGTKRKQDRLSIEFETQEARRPVRVVSPEYSDNDKTKLSKTGILVERNTCQVLRTRGRSTHGHSSDSTIQKLMYGSSYRKQCDVVSMNEECEKTSPNLAHFEDCLEELSMKFVTPATVIPYEMEIPAFDDVPLADVAQSILPNSCRGDVHDDVGEDFWNKLNLPVVFDRCIRIPLQAQINIVDRSLLDYFFEDLRLEEHFQFLQNRFFMQDGEFSQCLCDRLFDRFSKSSKTSDLFNPLTLNSILSEAVSYSSSAKWETSEEFEKNLAFVVKTLPPLHQANSTSVLDSLRLNYRFQFPINIIFSPDVCKYYERVFSFLLQLRHCLWASTEIYRALKLLDPSSPASVPSFYNAKQYRLLQLYRHEMHHFLRCLQEHLNLQAFQVTAIKFKADVSNASSFDELIALHTKYLKRVAFRCFLHKNAIPLMKLVRNIFDIILRFHSQLMAPMQNNYIHEMAKFAQLQTSYKIFKEYSTFLYQVVTKLVRRGYQTPLQEFLTRLDCNKSYSNQEPLSGRAMTR